MRFLSTLLASVLGTLIGLGVIVLFLVFFVFALALSGDQTPPVPANAVLKIDVEGPIPERVSDDPFQRAFGEGPDYDLRDLQTALRNAAADDRIQGVWVDLKGTTASWATLEEVRSALLRFRESGKPVYATAGEFGMRENEYFLASAADSAFSGPVTNFVHNGFSFQQPFVKETLDKLQIEPKVVRAGKYKSAVEPFIRSDFSEANREQFQAMLETINDTYKQSISASRGMTPEALEQMADEDAILDASVAVDRGFLDGLRHRDEVLDAFRSQLDLSSSADVSTIGVDAYSRQSPSSVGISTTGDGSVAVVYAEGGIVAGKTDDQFNDNQQIGSETLIEAIRTAQSSSDVKAIVLRINSPGGSAAASEAMWNAIQDAANDKPLIVSMGDLAASGGYYIAAPADTIVANATTLTGSIGVYYSSFNVKGFLNEKLGITLDEVQSSPYADMNSIAQPFSEDERQLFARSIDRTYETFLKRVGQGRGMDTTAVHEIAQGRIWTGRDALQVGLVDTLGTLEDAIQIAGRKGGLGDGPYRTRLLPRPKTFVEKLNSELYGTAARMWQSMGQSEIESTLLRHKRYLERRFGPHNTLQARFPYDIVVE